MEYEFEGKTEREAIDAAVDALGLERDEFDVEILETQKAGLFNLSKKVVIRVHTKDEMPKTSSSTTQGYGNSTTYSRTPSPKKMVSPTALAETKRGNTSYNPEPENDLEHALIDFLMETTTHMGFPAKPVITYREPEKIGIRLDSDHSGILIGKKGKNLDALQLLVNVIAARMIDDEFRVVLDSENYRSRREEALIRLAEKVGDQVKRSKKSRLLEPMNPFERRLIHTALANIDDIETKSEGDGLYKQVRVIYKGGFR
jgi:spoIIIJ-associated protein